MCFMERGEYEEDQDGEYEEDYYSYEGEMTVNHEIDPDDLIRTMEPAQIEKFIPKRTFEQMVKKKKDIKDGNCTICIDMLQNGELLREIPLCNHIYHADCLLNWLLVNEICPNCKNEVSIFTLRAYFESIRQSRGSQKKDKEPRSRPETSQISIGRPSSVFTSIDNRHPRFQRAMASHDHSTAPNNRSISRIPMHQSMEDSGMDWQLQPQTNYQL